MFLNLTTQLTDWAIDWASFPSDVIATFFGALLGLLTALWLERQSRRRDQRSRDLEGEKRASEVKDLIVGEVRRNRLSLTELQRELSGLDVPSNAPESTVWSSLCSEYLATTPDAVLPDLYSDIARIDRLLTEYRRALQQGGPSIALARRDTQPRLNDAVQRFLTKCDQDLPEARSTP